MQTLQDVQDIVRGLDPGLDPESETFEAATALVAALVVGAKRDKVTEFMDLDADGAARVAEYADRLEANGVWQGGITHCEWADGEEDSGIAFWLDVSVATGLLQKAASR